MTKRIDKDGRDVTYLPGLWSDEDMIDVQTLHREQDLVTAFQARFNALTAEHECCRLKLKMLEAENECFKKHRECAEEEDRQDHREVTFRGIKIRWVPSLDDELEIK
jgi:hypothetical protein